MKKIVSALLILASISCALSVFADADFEIPPYDNTPYVGQTEVILYQYGDSTPISIPMGNFENGGPGVDDSGDLLVPLRIAAVLSYNFARTEYAEYWSHEYANIEVPFDGNCAVVNGKTIEFRYQEIDDQIYFSHEYIPQLFNVSEEWDKERNKLILRENEDTPISEYEQRLRAGEYMVNEDYNTISVNRTGESPENYRFEVKAEGIYVDFGDDQPFIDDNNRAQVPVRYIAESLGCGVEWDDNSKTVTISTSTGKVIIITIGNNILTVDNDVVEMDTEAMIINERTYVPVRYLGEALDMAVLFTW